MMKALLLSLVCVLALVTPTFANQLAVLHVVLPVVPCNGIQYHGSYALNYQQAMYIKHVNISQPVKADGVFDMSLDTVDPAGQYKIAALYSPDRFSHTSYAPDAVVVYAAQAIAVEWSCTGPGSGQYTFDIYYSAAP